MASFLGLAEKFRCNHCPSAVQLLGGRVWKLMFTCNMQADAVIELHCTVHSHVLCNGCFSCSPMSSNLELLQKRQKEIEAENKKKKALVQQTLQERYLCTCTHTHTSCIDGFHNLFHHGNWKAKVSCDVDIYQSAGSMVM